MNNLKSRILDLSGGFNGFFVAVERDPGAPAGRAFPISGASALHGRKYRRHRRHSDRLPGVGVTLQQVPGDEPRPLPAQKTTLFLKIELGGDIR